MMYFRALYAVLKARQIVTVIYHSHTIGDIDALEARAHTEYAYLREQNVAKSITDKEYFMLTSACDITLAYCALWRAAHKHVGARTNATKS